MMPNNANNRLLQQALQAEGLYKGKIDGIIGPATRRALELHDQAKSQPLPRQRPSGVSLTGDASASGGPSNAMIARGQVLPSMETMPPMPDSTAEINNPSYGGPNPETAAGIRGGLNALLGREALKGPNQPSYAPQFTSDPSPAPMDDNALRLKMMQAQRTLGQILSDAVPQ